MHAAQKQFHEFIEQKKLIKKDDKVLLAVSGGVDSMVMADLFLNSKFAFAIAHCNFGLRGEASDGDEIFVKEWVEAHKVDSYRKRFKLGKGSTQLNARNARYEWFEWLLSKEGFDKLATAHHLNDSLETLLINLIRGTGIKGLSGITPSSGSIIRPMLGLAKREILGYAASSGLKWREDVTNKEVDYDRNLIRHEVIPVMERLNPSLLQTYAYTHERLNMSRVFIHSKVNDIRSSCLKKDGSAFKLDLLWIESDFDLLLLAEILADYGVNYKTSKDVFYSRKSPGKIFLTASWKLFIDRDCLYIRKNDEESLFEQTITQSGDYRISGGILSIRSKKVDEISLKSDNKMGFFDAAKAAFPMNLRVWREGDRFQPLGMKGKKKVSDFLIDQKVPLAKKQDQMVLTHDDQIVWVVGQRVAEPYKVTDQTKMVLVAEWKPQ